MLRRALPALALPLLFAAPAAHANQAEDFFLRSFLSATEALRELNDLDPRVKDCLKQEFLHVAEGGESSTGNVNTFREPGRACFTGRGRAVKACLVFPENAAQDFHLSEAEARDEVKAAFRQWKTYIDQHHLQGKDPPNSFADEIDLHASCDGEEDLRVYFGAKDAAVEAALQRNKNKNPWGLLSCTPPNDDGTWNKGLLWLSAPGQVDGQNPDWRDRTKLKAALLREMGRMFGNGDVDGTIMRADLSKWLSWSRPPEAIRELLTRIDWERSLDTEYRPWEELTVVAKEADPERNEAGFAALMKRKAKGPVTTRLALDEGYAYETRGTLSLEDEAGRAQFRLSARNAFTCPKVGERIFTTGTSRETSYRNSYACTQMGTLEDGEGRKIPVVLMKDGDGARYDIALPELEGAEGSSIFRYTPFPPGYRP